MYLITMHFTIRCVITIGTSAVLRSATGLHVPSELHLLQRATPTRHTAVKSFGIFACVHSTAPNLMRFEFTCLDD